MRKGTVNADR